MRTAIIISIIFASCSSRSSEESKNDEAIMLHNSMVRKVNLIEHRLNELNADTSVNRDSVVLLSKELEQWKTGLVEVPGNEEHNHGQHDHAHSHKEISDLTEEQMLAIQKELDERLSRIGTRLQQLKPKNNDQEHLH